MGFEETIKKFFFRKPKIELEGEVNDAKGKMPEDVAVKCEKCKGIILSSALKDNHSVCPKCGFHFKIGARERLNMIADENSIKELFGDLSSENLLEFPAYDEKLEKAKRESGENEGVIVARISMEGIPCVAFAMDYRFMMGSMGSVVGEKITAAFEYATKNKLPVLGFVLSGGARMQEGILSLMQMAKTSAAVGRHNAAGLLYLAVLTNPTTGGVSASFAYLADIIIAEPAALIGFAGPRVIEQTTRQKLPVGFQTAEFVLEKGFVDIIIPRSKLKDELFKLLKLHDGGVKA